MGRLNRPALLLLAGAMLCWSFSGIFVHFLGKHLGILTQSTFRYLSASLTLFFVSLVLFPDKLRIGKSLLYHIMLAALFGLLFQLAWVKALTLIQPGTASLIGEFGTIINVFLLSVFFLEEREIAKNKMFVISILIMLTGVSFVIIFNPNASFDFNLGALLVVLACICWGFYTIVLKRFLKYMNSIVAMAYVALFIALYHAIIAIFAGDLTEVAELPRRIIFILVISGVVSIAGSHSFFYMAIKRVPVVLSNNIMLGIPILVCVWSFLIFGERLTALQMAGGVLLILGSVMTARIKR